MGELSNIKFTTPEYDEIIPSTGETVKVKPFKVGDEKTLMIAAESKDQKQIINALRNVVNKCMANKSNTRPRRQTLSLILARGFKCKYIWRTR